MKNKIVKIFAFELLLLAVFCNAATAQEELPLYTREIPNAIKVKNEETKNSAGFLINVSQPTLKIYLPSADKANGTAVIICPGGGYSGLNMGMEGYDVAEKFNKIGVAAFVLKYRLPNDKYMVDKSAGPLQDAQQALLYVRKNARQLHIDPAKIGIMGFSAGGHLAATAGTHFKVVQVENTENISLRPDFMILVYPVISFTDSLTHNGSRESLIGTNPNAESVVRFSNELQVTADTPPTYLIHAGDDGLVTVKNSIAFYTALQSYKVSAALHIFPVGQHGFPYEPAHSGWFNYCSEWLRENAWLSPQN